jgi:hypothetical protein
MRLLKNGHARTEGALRHTAANASSTAAGTRIVAVDRGACRAVGTRQRGGGVTPDAGHRIVGLPPYTAAA